MHNPDGVEKGIKSLIVDGTSIAAENVPIIASDMLEKKAEVNVEAVMG